MGLRRPASASRRAGCAAQRMRIATPFVAAATCSGARANAGSSCCSSSTGGSSAATSCSSRRPAPARGQAPPRRSRGPAPPRASPAGPAGEGEGEVYEVRESDDDVWASIALPVTMSSAEGQQVEYLVLDTDGSLAEPAVESYLAALQKERGDEDAALKRASDDAADAKAAAGGGGDDWAMDPTLLKRMAVVRDAERGLIVQVGGCMGAWVGGRLFAKRRGGTHACAGLRLCGKKGGRQGAPSHSCCIVRARPTPTTALLDAATPLRLRPLPCPPPPTAPLRPSPQPA